MAVETVLLVITHSNTMFVNSLSASDMAPRIGIVLLEVSETTGVLGCADKDPAYTSTSD